jgi:Flp pilus assembly protein TadD
VEPDIAEHNPLPGMLDRAGVAHQEGRLAEARALCQQILSIDPRQARALQLLGTIESQSANHADAIALIARALAIEPALPGAHNSLGAAFFRQGRLDQAIAAFEEAHMMEPAEIEPLNNLGMAFKQINELDRAIDSFCAALAIKPGSVAVMNNMGASLLAANRLDEAIAIARQAIAIGPETAAMHWNLACALLKSGNFAEGLREHEYRFTAPGFVTRTFEQPRWDGGDLAGRRILLHAEQGLGDSLFYARYVPLVADRGGRVILECPPGLCRLFASGVAGVQAVVAQVQHLGQPLPGFDLHCPLGSLPLLFDTRVESIPGQVPYIKADADLSRQWGERTKVAGNRLKIGVAWAGNPRNPTDRHRSMPASALAPLASPGRAESVCFFSLQKGAATSGPSGSSPGELALTDFTAELNDFADTAALIDNLDLVICVDTSVAHLAGGMGKCVWMALSTACDWRNLADRGDSPWYPRMRVFRQRKLGDWTVPIDQMARALADLVAERVS